MAPNDQEQLSSVDGSPAIAAPPSKDWPWWWSTDQERYHGPCNSRADAILEAWAEDAEYAYVLQAQQGRLDGSLFDGWRLAEQFDDHNEENGDPDGDPPSEFFPKGSWGELATRLNRTVEAFVREHGVTGWAFTDQTKVESVDLSLAPFLSLPPRAASPLAALAEAIASGVPNKDLAYRLRTLRMYLRPDGEAAKREPSPHSLQPQPIRPKESPPPTRPEEPNHPHGEE